MMLGFPLNRAESGFPRARRIRPARARIGLICAVVCIALSGTMIAWAQGRGGGGGGRGGGSRGVPPPSSMRYSGLGGGGGRGYKPVYSASGSMRYAGARPVGMGTGMGTPLGRGSAYGQQRVSTPPPQRMSGPRFNSLHGAQTYQRVTGSQQRGMVRNPNMATGPRYSVRSGQIRQH